MTEQKKMRCAIYTRKSSEEGLDQNYNSLEAQRDAGEAYIKSQQHEGWALVKARYDDGGFSGGNMDRPGLKALLQDIRSGKIDVVIVYKIDRLTRALMDFSRLVEIFDAHGTTFVSVTQNFNTTSSMGRLTLNVLLSFAQFEREVTGERIRDKLAASAKKGIWMGGRLVLGYDLGDRKLVINEHEAEQVRFVFKEYLKRDSIYDLLAAMQQRGIKTKSWKTAADKIVKPSPYTTSTVYVMLKNPLYIGKIRHRDNVYDGEHAAIIDPETWNRVQEKLQGRTRARGGKHKLRPFLLRGKIFDEAGNKLLTSYSTRTRSGQKSFIRYYINKVAAVHGYVKNAPRTLNADELEGLTSALLRRLFKDQEGLYRQWNEINPAQKEEIIAACTWRFQITASEINIEFDSVEVEKIRHRYLSQQICFTGESSPDSVKLKDDEVTVKTKDNLAICSMPYIYKRYGGKKFITNSAGHEIKVPQTAKNAGMVTALITASQCYKMLEDGTHDSVIGLARHFKRDRSYISKIMKLDFLSPKIKSLVLDGQQPGTLTLLSLLQVADQVDWKKQEALLGL